MCNLTKVNKQKIISYTFKDDINDSNFFVNETNFDAFNRLINQESLFSFLYGPKKSGKSFLAHIYAVKSRNSQFLTLAAIKKVVDNDLFFLDMHFQSIHDLSRQSKLIYCGEMIRHFPIFSLQ